MIRMSKAALLIAFLAGGFSYDYVAQYFGIQKIEKIYALSNNPSLDTLAMVFNTEVKLIRNLSELPDNAILCVEPDKLSETLFAAKFIDSEPRIAVIGEKIYAEIAQIQNKPTTWKLTN